MSLESEILSIQDEMQQILHLIQEQQDVDKKHKEDVQAQLENFAANLTRLVQASQKLEAQNHDLRAKLEAIEQRQMQMEEAMGSLVRRLSEEFD